MRPRFERLYTKKYPPDAYRKESPGDGARCCRSATASAPSRSPERSAEAADTGIEQRDFSW